MFTAPIVLSPRAYCRRPWSPEAATIFVRWSGSTRRALDEHLRGRSRARTRRPLVGARRPRAIAVRRRLCAGESPRHVARIAGALSQHERRASRSVLSRAPFLACGCGGTIATAHLSFDSRALQRDLFRTGLPRALP